MKELNAEQREALRRLRLAATASAVYGYAHPIHCFPHEGYTPENAEAFHQADLRGIAMAIELERSGLLTIFPNTSSGIMVKLNEVE